MTTQVPYNVLLRIAKLENKIVEAKKFNPCHSGDSGKFCSTGGGSGGTGGGGSTSKPSIKETSAMVKTLSLPKGKGSNVGEGYYSWTKNGGYADKTLLKAETAAKKAGFKQSDSTGHSSPDGNVVGGGNVWAKGDWQLTMRSSYGVTSSNNYFSINLKHKPK